MGQSNRRVGRVDTLSTVSGSSHNVDSDTAFSASDQTEDHKSYDFFSYCTLDSAERYEKIYHEPVIPGSEIRGVIRSVYEVLTDSCMGVLNREEYPIKRTAAQFKPALIHRKKNGTMELYDAFSFRLGQAAVGGKIPNGFENCKNGSPVYFNRPQKQNRGYGVVRDYSFQKQTGMNVTGYLLKWGMGVKKARYHVFTLKEVNQQNIELEEIHHGVKEIKNQAKLAGEAIKNVGAKVKSLDKHTDKTGAALDSQNKKLKDLLNKIRTSDRFCVDLILFLILLGLIAVLYCIIKNKF